MQRRGPICSCTAGSLQARLIPRWFRPYSVHRVPRWKGVPLSEYIPIKKSELRYTRLCPACTLHPAPCTFHPLASAFLFPFLQPSLFPCLSFLLARSIFTSPPQLTSSHPTPFTSAFCLPPTEIIGIRAYPISLSNFLNETSQTDLFSLSRWFFRVTSLTYKISRKYRKYKCLKKEKERDKSFL